MTALLSAGPASARPSSKDYPKWLHPHMQAWRARTNALHDAPPPQLGAPSNLPSIPILVQARARVSAGLAALVGKAYVVGATAPSVAAAARADPEQFVLAEKGGTLGVEELMEQVEDFVGSFILG